MRPAQQHLVGLGFRLGLVYPTATYVMSYIQHNVVSMEFCAILFGIHFCLSLPALLMPSDRQVEWYRCALFLPWSSIWAGVLLAVSPDGHENLLAPVVACAALLALLGAPVVWLVGALWIWRSNHLRMRSLAR
jgi:hypothetical protein